MDRKKSLTGLSWRPTILVAILAVRTTLALGQGVTSQPTAELSQHPYELSKESQPSHPSSLLAPVKSPTLEEPYRPITASQTLR
jgi:hypothetical protein